MEHNNIELNTNNNLILEEPLQYITFRSGQEKFGIQIDYTREIIKTNEITPIPNFPEYIKGIINVRGEIVTAIDVKSLFMLSTDDNYETKHIIVTKKDNTMFGLMVSEVCEVIRVFKNDIKPAPDHLDEKHSDFASGIFFQNENLIIILNVNKILYRQDFTKPLN